MIADNTPILIGGGQVTQRDVPPDAAASPLDMMAEASRLAAKDARGGKTLLAAIDRVAVVNIFGWRYENAPRALAEQLEIGPSEEIYSTIGGNTPQWLVTETAEAIAAGRVGVALIAGAEAMYSVARARRAGVKLGWKQDGGGTPIVVGDTRDGISGYEGSQGLMLPIQIYPLFENAIRAAAGRSIAEHQRHVGTIYSRFTEVAAKNPYAWFQTARSADELVTVTAENRYIGFPYPKHVNAIIDVDQAAAVLMTSVGRARALGIPESRWVYLRGSGEAHDHWFVSERTGYHASPAMRVAGADALGSAGVAIGDVAHVDLYSCFPCAVEMARDALGLSADDSRPLTVTGGLAYFGGPGNDYVTHSIATMLDRCREQPGSLGLVTALGWYATKHAVGIYSTDPGATPWRRRDPKAAQAIVDADPKPALAEARNGPATIETYTVLHGRDGAPMRGVVIGRLDDRTRFLADTPVDRETFESLESSEGVGRRGTVSTRDGQRVFALS